MKKLIYLISIPLLLFVAGCSDDDEKNPLEGTKWKLEGYVTSENTEIKVLETSDCEKCYTISFYTKTEVGGFGVANTFGGEFKAFQDELTFENLNFTEIGALFDEKFYFELLKKSHKFQVAGNKLYLYSDKKSSYLLFKSITL